MPKAVTTRGSQHALLAEHWHTLFEFENDVCCHATSGTTGQQGRPFLHGFEIQLERATLCFEFAVTKNAEGEDVGEYLCPPTLLNENGQAVQVELGDGDPMLAFQAELTHASQVVSGNADPEALAGELARDALAICQSESESLLANLTLN